MQAPQSKNGVRELLINGLCVDNAAICQYGQLLRLNSPYPVGKSINVGILLHLYSYLFVNLGKFVLLPLFSLSHRDSPQAPLRRPPLGLFGFRLS